LPSAFVIPKTNPTPRSPRRSTTKGRRQGRDLQCRATCDARKHLACNCQPIALVPRVCWQGIIQDVGCNPPNISRTAGICRMRPYADNFRQTCESIPSGSGVACGRRPVPRRRRRRLGPPRLHVAFSQRARVSAGGGRGAAVRRPAGAPPQPAVGRTWPRRVFEGTQNVVPGHARSDAGIYMATSNLV
jgi:hypothetical protein